MQLNVMLARIGCATLAAALLGITACNDGNAAGAGADDTAGAAAGSYLLITQRRPEVPSKFFQRERAIHDLCATAARAKNIPVKPFPVVPNDFFSTRSTYASDGKRVVFREVTHVIDVRKMQPEGGCEARLVAHWRASVIGDGQERGADADEDGKVHVAGPQPVVKEAVRASLLGLYAQSKRINGVPLKCNAQATCIVDPAVVTVARGMRPVQAASRIDDVRTYGSALVLEPVSLSVGKPVDAKLFSLEKTD